MTTTLVLAAFCAWAALFTCNLFGLVPVWSWVDLSWEIVINGLLTAAYVLTPVPGALWTAALLLVWGVMGLRVWLKVRRGA